MNKLEQDYAATVLEPMKQAGLIQGYEFERLKLRLADKTFYTPDFLVVRDECFEIHEVKGHWEDDARVKIKVAAEMFPWFLFKAIRRAPKREGGGWVEELFNE